MRSILLFLASFILITSTNMVFAADDQHNAAHQHDMNMMDTRTSLNLSPQMKQHQLSNMREHVKAIKIIVGLMAENKFEEASGIAHNKLGLTPQMQAMCSNMGNDEFKTIGLAFHNSGDELGEVLLTNDVNASLRALNKTMQYCVQCHATFRQ